MQLCGLFETLYGAVPRLFSERSYGVGVRVLGVYPFHRLASGSSWRRRTLAVFTSYSNPTEGEATATGIDVHGLRGLSRQGFPVNRVDGRPFARMSILGEWTSTCGLEAALSNSFGVRLAACTSVRHRGRGRNGNFLNGLRERVRSICPGSALCRCLGRGRLAVPIGEARRKRTRPPLR